jgi:serine/threonine-protein kinase
MRNHQLTCDPQRIELFLEQRLSDAEQSALELHLDDCDRCRRRLETAAADAEVWSAVRESLGGEPPAVEGPGPACDGPAGDASFSRAAVLGLLAPTDDDRMLGRLGTYEVVGIVGSGGMGVVLKAFDPALNRYVAIKVLAPHLGASGAARRRFSREAQAAAAVVHENVMEIYGVDDAAGLPYLVMPYVRGPSLQRRLDEQGPLALAEILRIGMQAASGLGAAHAQGLVHRDVKPANILLADGVERVKLTDFGLARAADDASLTRTGFIAGTPQYMSPEQARGEAVDSRSDLFSLGSVMYAMCTGRLPFRAETSYGVLRRITDEEPRPIREINPEVPEWLCRIIARLMAKHPEERFQSAAEVAQLFEACLAHVQQPSAARLPEELCRLESPADAKTPDQPRRASGRFRAAWNRRSQEPGASAPRLIPDQPRRASGRFRAAWNRRSQEPGASAPRLISRKALLVAAFVVAVFLAGVVIVLQLDKGTLTIESEVDDVSVRVTRGSEVVERLTVKQTGETIRIAAGTYVVEIEGDADGIAIENGAVKVERGGREIVRIVKSEEAAPGGNIGDDRPDPDDRRSLEYAAKQFNAMSAKERKALFDPPIPDLTVERLREGFRQAAELYRLGGKRQIADTLQQIATTGRLPEEATGGLFSSGVHAQDDRGETVSQQVVPSLILPEGGENRLVVLRPLELLYKRGGPISKDYGDLFDPKEDLAASSGRAADVPAPGPYPSASPGGEPMTPAPLPTTPQATAPDPRPVRRFATGLTGHALVLAYSPDGRRLAVANGNPTRVLRVDGTSYVEDWKAATRILDAETGDIVLSLELATAEESALLANTPQLSHFEVTAMAFSPDGDVLAVGTDIGQVKLFDAATGVLIRSLDHEQEKLLEPETPKTLKALPRALGSVASLAFSPDGALLAVCGETFAWFGDRFDRIERGGLGRAVSGPGRLKVWNLQTGALSQDLAGHSHAYAVAFSPDFATLASAGRWEDGSDRGTGVIFWSAQSGEKMLVKPTLANGGARWLAISPDGRLAAIGSQVFDKDAPDGGSMGDIALIRTASGITEWQTRVPRWAKPLFSPDGKTVAVLCGGPAIRFLNAQTGLATHEVRAAEGVQWVDFAGSPQGSRLAIGVVDRELKGTIEICDFGNAGAAEPVRSGPAQGTSPAATILPSAPPTDGAQFSEPQEVLLSIDSSRFLLDLDTGRTMDPPATIRPEQGLMDVCTDQVQPYQLPRGLTCFLLHGMEVKPSDWDAAPSEVRRRLAESARPLSQMNHFPTAPATYFFRTRDGAEGVLQLLDLVNDPKGLRIRYKTVVRENGTLPH